MRICVSVAISLALVACSREATSPPATATSVLVPASASAPPAAKALSPLIQEAIECLAKCRTDFNGNLDKAFKPIFDLKFSDFADKHREKLEATLQQLPAHFMAFVRRQPDDIEGFEMSPFGLARVHQFGARQVYFYRLVGYNRRGLGSLAVVADGKTGDMAALVQSPDSYENYYLAGPTDMQAVLLADVATYEVVTAQAEIAGIKADQKWEPVRTPPMPLDAGVAAAVKDRLLYYNSILKNGVMQGVAKPAEALEADRIRSAAAWYAVNVSGSKCVSSLSPATRIQQLRDHGLDPRTRDTTDADGNLTTVEVSVSDGTTDTYWTYFKSVDQCDASNQKTPIPDRYK